MTDFFHSVDDTRLVHYEGCCWNREFSDGMKDLIDDGVNGYLTDDDTVMAEKLLAILNDAAHRNFLGENARKKFGEINNAPKYKQAIADCYKR